MGTKSTRSAGSQFSSRGITQGNTLVGPTSGLPFNEVVDTNGVRRLAVDAALTLDSVVVDTRDLTPLTDQVSIGDHSTGNSLTILPDGSLNANVEIDAADGDNIAISDGTHTLAINPDGSINVKVSLGAAGELKNIYTEITAVVSGVLSTIVSYVAPIGKTSYLQKVEFSGSNIATYTVLVNSAVQSKKRTYFGGALNDGVLFTDSGNGLPLIVGDIVTVKVIHNRPTVGDFEARLQVTEV